MHIPACITTYCSICKGHDGLVENCIKAGVEYFTSAADFCSQQQPGVAAYMPDMQFLSQLIN
jgi:ribosomal protein L44E